MFPINNIARKCQSPSAVKMPKRDAIRTFLEFMAFALICKVAAAENPRMWKVSDPKDPLGSVLYVLGISHIGTQLEYDQYLESRVIPAFLASDVLHFEDGGKVPASKQPSCSNSLQDPPSIASLKNAREIVEKGALEFFSDLSSHIPNQARDDSKIHRNAEIYAAELSEFGVVETLRFQYTYFSEKYSKPNPTSTAYPYEPIVSYLRKMRPTIRVASIDSPTDLVEAYCSAGESRAKIITDYAAKYDINKIGEIGVESNENLADRANEKLLNVLNGKDNRLNTYESVFTCFRTRLWVERIGKLMDGRVHFLALGAAHLFPSTGPTASCRGLLEDLRSSGLRVETVR